MKRFLAAILFLIYTGVSSGATIDFHYCMGKLTGWNVHSAASVSCINCGMNKEQKKSCCNDKHTTLQLKKDQLASNMNGVPDCPVVYTQNYYSISTRCSLLNKGCIINSINSPPLIQSVSISILNSLFRI